jgi:hypothetical protein
MDNHFDLGTSQLEICVAYFRIIEMTEIHILVRSGPGRLDRPDGFVRCNPCGL